MSRSLFFGAPRDARCPSFLGFPRSWALGLLSTLILSSWPALAAPLPLIDAQELAGKSHEHEAENFQLTLETPGSATTNQMMDVEVHIVAKNGKKINLEYPARLRVEHPEIWELNEGSHRLVPDGQDKPVRATLLGSVTPRKTGPQLLSVKVSFSVCTDQQCLIEKIVLSERINVK